MKWRVEADAGLCVSSGVCVSTAPGRFRFDESGHSIPEHAVTEPDDRIRDAAAFCPVGAIRLTDAGTGEPIPLDD